MIPIPEEVVGGLGLDVSHIIQCHTVSKRHGHHVWRIRTHKNSRILKWFPADSTESTTVPEVESYRLLRQLGVPTLPVYGLSAQAILIEDLHSSQTWRLASQADMNRGHVGEAVARWYVRFHEAGARFLSQPAERPSFLARESDLLMEDRIRELGRRLDLSQLPVWQFAADHIDLLTTAEAHLSLTLNYNDFHWTNLALTRATGKALEAVVFDYHLLGMGMRYSDCRNVTGSLAERATAAFWRLYGQVNPQEKVIDKPLSTLHSLVVAAERPVFPSWAQDSRQRAISGALMHDLKDAVTLARTLCEPTA